MSRRSQPNPPDQPGFTHTVIGAVHSIRPEDAPGAVRGAVEHEVRSCDSVRIVIDLTDRRGLDAEDVQVILDTVESRRTHEDWRIVVGPDTSGELTAALEAAGWGDIVERAPERS